MEEVIRRYPGIKDATVAAYDNPAGGKFIAAYICSDERVDIEAMNSFIRSEKPPYMVPAVTMQIEAIPYTQNLKVNKRALPKPELTSADTEQSSGRPMTRLEERLAAIAERAAGIKITDAGAPLISVGLTSLSAISFVKRMEKEMGMSLPVKKILGGFSLIDIENALVDELFTRENTAAEAAPAAANKYPLTETQFGIYSECMMDPQSTVYNIPCSYRIDRATGAQRLADALFKVIDAHSAVKCTIEADANGDLFMVPHNDAPVEISVLNGSGAEQEEYWRSFARPFDMSKGLYRIAVYETDEYLYLMAGFHHIMFDGTSQGIFVDDLNRVLAGGEPEGESKSIFDLALREKKLLDSPELTEAKRYYDTLMNGASGCVLPDPDLSEEEEKVGMLRISRPELRESEVRAFCEKHGVTPNAFFLAAAGIVLGKYAYSDDVSFTTIYNGRSDTDILNSFGMFVKTLPIRCSPEPEKKTAEFVADMGKQLLANMSNDLYSFAKISRAYGLSADYMLVYQGEGFGGSIIDGREAVQRVAEQSAAKSDISTDVWVENGAYRFETEYRANKYSREYIERYTDVLATAAKSMLDAETLGDIDIASEEQAELIERFNDTDVPLELRSIDRLFEEQAAAHPDMTAVIANSESLTYAQLNDKANRLAHSLRDMGLENENVVGIVLDRTKEVYICEYGILKAGGAFLPMTSEYPDDRIDFCLVDAQCPFVITTQSIKAERPELFAADKPYRTLTVEELICRENGDNLGLDIPTSSLAYCIYTSGSTGKPKGVMIEHGNLANFVNANERNDETRNLVYPGEVMLAIAAISFDISIMESFIPLLNGMTACMANDDEIHNPLMLCDLIEKNNVTVMCATPSFIMNIVDIPQVKKVLASIKAYDLGAEAFPGALYDKLHSASPNALIINGYGPTEATISCISKIITSSKNITIGMPAANVRAYVMDKACHIMPAGISGELVICGKGTGRGYMNLPEKTREVFIEYNGERAYRSGDLVRYNAQGEIEFFGRLDNQVKLRGLRVELDEIENVMNGFDGVLVSKVIVRNNGSEDYLAGFFTAERPIEITELTEYMKSKLTAYMVPAALVQLDEMPLTVNGKIDKKQLPATEVTAAREYTAPETAVEKELCDKFAEILSLDMVGALDSFFEIGGTSLSATKVVMYALTKGYNIVYKDVFDNPTPRALAAFIEGDTRVNTGAKTSEEYDYTDVRKALSKNVLERVDGIKKTELARLIIILAVTLLVVFALLLIVIDRRILEPLRRISESMDRFAKEKKQQKPLGIRSHDEIRLIADSYENMSRDILSYIDDIEKMTAERMQAEVQMDVARRIQCGMVPTKFKAETESCNATAIAYPAKEVGGDFYDCFESEDGVCLVMGDVSGKGIGAALFMAMAKTMIREKLRAGMSPAAALNSANDELCAENPEGMFATVFAAVFDKSTGELRFANAGHTRPVIISNGSTRLLNADPGIALGLFEDAGIIDDMIVMDKGNGILLYTDGVTETVSRERTFFGEERLLANTLAASSAELIEKGADALRAFADGAEQFDDITALAVFFDGENIVKLSAAPTHELMDEVKGVIFRLANGSPKKLKIIFACEEINTNIVSYSGADSIEYICALSEGTLTVRISDNGKPFDPLHTEIAEKEFEEYDTGGMGINLVKQIAEKLVYRRIGNENVLKMVFRLTA